MHPDAPLHVRITSLAALLTPALALWLPSGYAYGTMLLLIGALAAAARWWRQPLTPSAGWLAAAVVLMALVWLYGSDWGRGIGVLNRPLRYLLAVPCLLYALCFPPRPGYLLAGLAAGAAGGGLRALFDTQVLGLDRPWTSAAQTGNAIQMGDLSALFGLMCWIALIVYWPRWRWSLRLAVMICCDLGLLGSLLSQTRGGWLAMALTMPPVFWLLVRQVSLRRAAGGLAVLCLLLLPQGWMLWPQLAHRIDWTVNEVASYRDAKEADTSIGQRLDHWQLAWTMGRDRPIVGWGDAGYVAEKARRVGAGQADIAVLRFGHTHNEALDQFVKRGLIGVTGLLVLYLVPLALFWPRAQAPPGTCGSGRRDDRICLRLMGVAFVVAYIGFGLTQVFFAHYNGVVIYLAMVILIFAALTGAAPVSAEAKRGA
ncbi:MAG: O-antigen ligase family protein [Burkholderiaceae bacterium]|nr:O-antigen ligase family protein [Burkholderiaceae bacterium]